MLIQQFARKPRNRTPILINAMKFLLASLALLCVAVSSTLAAPLPASCSTAIPRDSCAFYMGCLEAKFPCGSDGYAVGYGNKYCRAFSDNAAQFSDMGKRWISDVMVCLQTELVPLVNATTAVTATTTTTKPTCPTIKKFAFDSHPKCYLQAGVCTLPLSDWFALSRVIGFKQLLADLDAIKQEFLVAINCPGKWLQALRGNLRDRRE
jgi:hypothetical protein